MLSLFKNEGYFFLCIIGLCSLINCEALYNMQDPDCTGKFGTCTQEDKTRLGYAAIKKLHERMDEDKDGGIEVEETKDFIKADLNMKNGQSAKQLKDSDGDGAISVEELWKSWEYSEAYNWTSDQMVSWLTDHLNLPGYKENFERNMIDGQFLPRLVTNEKHYYSNVLQIKDLRHKRLMILKATDIVLFGVPPKHSILKDILLVGLLTISVFVCMYFYRQQRRSSEKINEMLLEFEKLSAMEEKDKNDVDATPLNFAGLELANKRNSIKSDSIDDVGIDFELKKANSQDDDSVYKLQLAEQEMQRLKDALIKAQSRLDTIRYQPPLPLISLLNKTYESEKALLEFKLQMIEKEKTDCVAQFNKIVKNQSGFMGSFKTAHSSSLEELQQKLEAIKSKHQKLKVEQQESTKRWNHIFEMCVRQDHSASSNDHHGSQEILYGTNGFHEGSQRAIRYEELRQLSQPTSFKSITQNSLSSNETSASSGRIDSTRLSKYTIGDRISTAPNLKFPASNQKIEFNLDSSEEISAINGSSDNNNTDKYHNGNPANSKLVIITPANLPQIQHQQQQHSTSPQHSNSYGSIPNVNGKIARDSIISSSLTQPDIFQFSEVESVHTADFFFKNTPQSSFDSQDTYKSNSLLPSLIKSRNSNQKVRTVTNNEYNPKEKKQSFFRSSFSKLPKTPTEKERSEGEAENIDRTSTLSFSRTMSNLRSKIFSSNKNLFSSQTIKPVQAEDKIDPISISKPEIVITPSPVNSMVQLSQSQSGTKQLTISNLKVDDDGTNCADDKISQTNNSGSSGHNLNVSMNRSPASISSFTVQTPNNGEVSPQLQPQQMSQDAEKKTPTSIFNLGIGKSKKSKSKSPKKKKV